MKRDHYLILGVTRSESDTGIQTAFRALAKRFHPDVAGREEAPRFREIVEAYSVLSDPAKRRVYDEQLRGDRRAPPFSPSTGGYGAEPLIPEPLSITRDFPYLARSPDFVHLSPSREAFFGQVRRNFDGHAHKAEQAEPLNVVVRIPAEKALHGGTITVGVPVYRHCPACRGTGSDWLVECGFCSGEGLVQKEVLVPVRVPAFAGRRAVVDVPLFDRGIENLYLRLLLYAEG